MKEPWRDGTRGKREKDNRDGVVEGVVRGRGKGRMRRGRQAGSVGGKEGKTEKDNGELEMEWLGYGWEKEERTMTGERGRKKRKGQSMEI